jgi:adenylyltransferase/sulfurtransferase
MVQATEVLKYLLHDGRLLTNRLFIWDGLESHAEEIAVERNPACPVCGEISPVKPPARKKK